MNNLSSKNLTQLKTAIIYDRVTTTYGGAEQVLQALTQLFPSAPIFTSIYDHKKASWAKSHQVIPSFLQKIPILPALNRWLLPLMPLAFESLDLKDYQLIISVTSGQAKGVLTSASQKHLCYLLTPPRYLYAFDQEYLQNNRFINLPIIKQFTNKLLQYIKWWDQVATYRPDMIVPLSKLVKNRAKTVYQIRTTQPIYPPSDVINLKTDPHSITDLNLPAEYLVCVNRLVPYKRIDLAIQASVKLNQNLVIIGEGPEKKRLLRLAKQLAISNPTSKIILLPSLEQVKVNTITQQAKLFLAPGIDDFGLSPLHANLLGTPAVINEKSGVAEIFSKDQGVTISDSTISATIKATQQALLTTYNSDKMKACVQLYNTNKFLSDLKSMIKLLLSK